MNAPDISPYLLMLAKSLNAGVPRHLGERYDAQGVFLPEPGNTVVCHIIAGSETESALAEARSRCIEMQGASRIAFTPLSSLHMTLFQGVIEYRRSREHWPADMPLETPIDDMTAILRQRIDYFAGGPPFRVRVVEALPTGLILQGASESDNRSLAIWRDRLADLFGYRHPDHDGYVFHITFGYMIDWLPDETLGEWQRMLREVTQDIQRRAPILELKPPAFSSFDDMNRFDELVVLPVQDHSLLSGN